MRCQKTANKRWVTKTNDETTRQTKHKDWSNICWKAFRFVTYCQRLFWHTNRHI